MDAGGIRSRFPALAIDFYLLHSAQTGAGATRPRIHFVSRVISSGAEQPRREFDHSHLVRRLRMHRGVSPFHVRLHGVVPNYGQGPFPLIYKVNT